MSATVWIHQRICDAATLNLIMRQKRPEDQWLDYKVKWSDSNRKSAAVECAKDVAAMANAQGGDLVVGVEEDPNAVGQPGSFAPHQHTDAEIGQWIRQRLEPAAVGGYVRFSHLQVGPHNGVLVVSVPAWVPGLVAVQTERAPGADRPARYHFPIRERDHTRFLTWAEVEGLMEGSARRARLCLKSLKAQGANKVRFSGGVYRPGSGTSRPAVVFSPVEQHGAIQTVDDIGDSHCLVRMRSGDRPLHIPYELVRAVWRDGSDSELINITLEATVMLINDTTWMLRTDLPRW